MSFTESLHQLSFGCMGVAAVLALAVSTERFIYAAANQRRAKHLLGLLTDTAQPQALHGHLGQDTVSEMVQQLLRLREPGLDASVRQDKQDAAYLHAKDEMVSRMWILDTVVTAAPLLGLLGTIFGIVDTFLALSQSGMSDPSKVSAGIGTALYATAMGIGIALLGLISFNYLNDRNDRLGEKLKMLILML